MVTQSTEIKLTETQRLWRELIDRAALFQGTAADFCKSEGLRLGSFYKWRHEFSHPKSKTKKKSAEKSI